MGYFFHPTAWGQGYATELVGGACTSLADDELRLPEVAAFARPENVRSHRVLVKAGFAVVRRVPDIERFLYRRTRHRSRRVQQAAQVEAAYSGWQLAKPGPASSPMR